MNQREQDWQYLTLYHKHGEYSAAAREIGMNVSSFKRRIKHYESAGVMVGGKPNREAFDAAEPYKGATVSRTGYKAPSPAVRVQAAPASAAPAFSAEEVAVLKALVQREQAARKEADGGAAIRSGEERVQGFRMDTGVFAAFQAYCKEAGVKMGGAVTVALEEYLERRQASP